MVGYAMAALPHNTDVPWYRVINSQGRISLPPESGGGIQCKLLENENIIFEEEGRLDLEKYKWYPYT
jgi:methylated-DNA-protein-cysteine methyltransferase-like protein